AGHHPRPRIPYSPLFLEQVRADNVVQITTKGTAVQGELKQPITYGKKKTSRFKTEIPSFANTDALSKLLQEHNVVINAQPLDTGTPWWENLLFGFGPTLVFLALLVWLMRRAGGGAGSVVGGLGGSPARGDRATGGRGAVGGGARGGGGQG